MANPSTNEVLFVVIVVILFFILLGVCLFCIYKATTPTRRERERMDQLQMQRQAQIQYITHAQLESMQPPELARQLNEKSSRQSVLTRFFQIQQEQQEQQRPSSTRVPSFLPMHHQQQQQSMNIPHIVIDDNTNNSMAARDAEIAYAARQLPPPAYGDNRTSIPLSFPRPPTHDEKQ
ncbi:hypothetical protein BCR43DRAFT_513539 [Syncephalastrum racemosum]|uniref:Uncharacterized protein n=1 Tax=Syncephalastrum racemosum TaxID=13706 RepID=A0A1X2HJZ6_SYNRA|nr:hypothetical protein BCR43DRAFT_513539 [Syncephalastrum racemosum]